VVCGLSMLLLAGCGATIPTDPDGTLDRASGGTLRVGATENGSWVDVREGEDPVGTEPELVRSFASALGAEVEWSTGSEEALVGDLEEGDLDLVIGGLTAETPWSEKAGTTR
jgi:membrane-bound lytic murein transglycosylase MltF